MPAACRRAWRVVLRHFGTISFALVALLCVSPTAWAENSSAAADETPLPGLIAPALPCQPGPSKWFDLHCRLMADPVRSLPRIEAIEREIAGGAATPAALFDLLARYRLGKTPHDDSLSLDEQIERLLDRAADPLAIGLCNLVAECATFSLPDRELVSGALRYELGRLLLALASAESLRRQAFEKLPPAFGSDQWIAGLADNNANFFGRLDLLAHIENVDDEALLAGMKLLVSALERFRAFALAWAEWPALVWHIETSRGAIVVDLTTGDDERTLARPFLLIDRGGNDRYRFVGNAVRAPISVVLDLAGDDDYRSDGPAACPATAIMGYGILWDESGSDRYRGTQLTQAAAVMGSALLYDGDGANDFDAINQSQAFALFGTALLMANGLNADRYSALSLAQGSAMPGGAALLFDRGGDDHYLLGNEPIIYPSSQLADHNASLGQGTGFGIRQRPPNPSALGGGVGILFDAAGDDTYRAQVFAQGSGYFHGVGLLFDRAGQDSYRAAWYAMGAAAHGAVGALIDRGAGDDSYVATHATSIAAAHDRSLAVLLDEAGNDDYDLGTLGLGAAHEESVALFVDLAGSDRYRVKDPSCQAFGVAIPPPQPNFDGVFPYPGFFIDAGDDDAFPAHCLAGAKKELGE